VSLRVGLVHATLAAVGPMVAAFRDRAPEARLLHFLDEGLLEAVNRDGLTPLLETEFERLARRAVDSGVDGILMTCSAFSPLAPSLRHRLSIPLVSADEAMLQRAVQLGPRIRVIATVDAAGPTAREFLQRTAAASHRSISVQVAMVPEAFAALRAGDGPRHDRLIQERIDALAPDSDVIVLAQISMARAAAGSVVSRVPVLTSPAASIDALLRLLAPKPAVIST
jgi:Asp/Glu/hydantoin racemase